MSVNLSHQTRRGGWAHASCPRRHEQPWRPRPVCSPAALADFAPLAAVALPVAGLVGWRLSLYSQLELITARMIGNFVPKESSVLQLGGSTKELFYYTRAQGVTVVGEDITPGLFNEAGAQAAVPTVARQQPCSDLSFVPTSSMDAVVCMRSVARTTSREQQALIISEATRVLRPGAPLIFIEPLSDGASAFRGVIGSAGKATPMAASTLEDLLASPTLDVLQVDVALPGSDPHAVGVARRTSLATPARPAPKVPKEAGGPEDTVRQSKRKGKDLNLAAGGKGFRKGS